MCDLPAVTREHAPPLCFFPEQKDLPGAGDLRRNLITVPSCDGHNSALAKDDEYAMVVVASHIGNNGIATSHFGTKVHRALTRSPVFTSIVFATTQPVMINGLRTVAFEVDSPRFERVMA
ncbi:MAG: hypothetical protein ACREL4_02785, partial [Gemmatimonadales bacterium]